MRAECDIAIIGSGFAGSLLAMIARRQGRSVILVERGKHPRVVIGESSTPLSNLLLEEITSRYDLPNLKSFAKWGTWQKEHPEIPCGLKRGFTFYHHDLDRPKADLPARSEQLLVAASPHNEIADTHWYRADFDQYFVWEAQRLGVTYLDETHLVTAVETDSGLELAGARADDEVIISARFVVDASGPHGFLHGAFKLAEVQLPAFPQTQALYSHFARVRRLDDVLSVAHEAPPFPVDDAAVHHIFDGGWIWVLRFDNGITSAGIAATDGLGERLRLGDGKDAWTELLKKIPILEEQFSDAISERPFARIPRLSFRSGSIVGDRWALLPSAVGFVDPLLSTGFPLTLLGVSRLAEIFENHWDGSGMAEQLKLYATRTDSELVATSELIAGLYASMKEFPIFIALTLLYFAAATFSETARRLKKYSLADSFLLHKDPIFGPALKGICARARGPLTAERSQCLIEDIQKAIEPFNIAGLGDSTRKNWYPVETNTLMDMAWKLQSNRSEIAELLERCGFRT